MSAKPRPIFESFGSKTGEVDLTKGIAYGVKVVGFVSKNGRYYKPSALQQAVPLYEGIKVYFDHVEDKDAKLGRKFGEKFGVLRKVHFVENAGVFADLHFNPKHQYAEQFAWDANNDPESLGLSHHATTLTARSRDRHNRTVVEQIVKVKSVDVVPDPATTQSLFESTDMDPKEMPDGTAADPVQMMLNTMASEMATIAESEGDGASKMGKLADMIRKQDKLMSMLMPARENVDPKPEGDMKPDMAESTDPTIVSLQNQIAKLTTIIESRNESDKKATLKSSVETALEAAGLDASNREHVSDLFAGQLLATESVEVRTQMIEERAKMVGVGKRKLPTTPKSTGATFQESTNNDAPKDPASFVKSLR